MDVPIGLGSLCMPKGICIRLLWCILRVLVNRGPSQHVCALLSLTDGWLADGALCMHFCSDEYPYTQTTPLLEGIFCTGYKWTVSHDVCALRRRYSTHYVKLSPSLALSLSLPPSLPPSLPTPSLLSHSHFYSSQCVWLPLAVLL